jgi:hypothetical protein
MAGNTGPFIVDKITGLRQYFNRVVSTGGTIQARPVDYNPAQINKLASLNPTILLFPSAYKNNSLYSLISSIGTTDITSSRASSASYFDSKGILQVVNNNIPRFDYNPLTSTFNGILLDPPVMNYFSGTSDINTYWTKQANCTEPDTIMGYPGLKLMVTQSGDINNNASFTLVRRSTFNIRSGSNVFSMLVKTSTSHGSVGVWVYSPVSASYSVGFDVNTLTISRPQTFSNFTNRTGSIVPLGNNSYLCWEKFTSDFVMNNLQIGISPTNSGTQTMTSGSVISVAAPQLTQTKYLYSTIPTTTNSGSIAQDTLSTPPLSGSATWALIYEVYLPDLFDKQYLILNGNPLYFYLRRTGAQTINFWNQSGAQQSFGNCSYTGNIVRAGMSWDGTQMSTIVNAGTINKTTAINSGSVFTNFSGSIQAASINVGTVNDPTTAPLYFRSLAVYNYALSDAQLTNLTTL